MIIKSNSQDPITLPGIGEIAPFTQISVATSVVAALQAENFFQGQLLLGQLILEPEIIVPENGSLTGLGRRQVEDPKDLDHRLVAPVSQRTSRYWLSLGKPLDQGNTSQCVSHAGIKWLTTHPIVNTKINFTPAQLYLLCQRRDEWPGEEPTYEGTSVRALMKVLKDLGYISRYEWAFDLETVVNHLLNVGPVVMGTDWTREMFMPDRNGFIADDGPNEGGHAWLIIGVNTKKRNPLTGEIGAVRILNSWGDKWAQKGRAWMSFSVLARLINNYGEAAVAYEIKKAA